jgi:glycosyltransferase involved in cell wall biosynthesis
MHVEFKGPIPYTQVFGTMQQYHLFVLPTLGENYGHVIYEALSAGDPVLISDKTPWKNLKNERVGWDLPLNEKEKFKDAIIEAANWNQEEYNELSKNAFLLAKNSVDIPRLHDRYKRLFG